MDKRGRRKEEKKGVHSKNREKGRKRGLDEKRNRQRTP
jgi:hypothetical protein